jgi:hypothetical protein
MNTGVSSVLCAVVSVAVRALEAVAFVRSWNRTHGSYNVGV